jgi:hypothetical protein
MRRFLLCLVGILLSQPAYAYRPFNSTDAAVAERGEMELECGPLAYVVESAVTVHVNGTLLVTHEHTLRAVAGAIVEGPSRWVVRPVAEAAHRTAHAAAMEAASVTIDPIATLRFESS